MASGTFHLDGGVQPEEPVAHAESMTWPLLVTLSFSHFSLQFVLSLLGRVFM